MSIKRLLLGQDCSSDEAETICIKLQAAEPPVCELSQLLELSYQELCLALEWNETHIQATSSLRRQLQEFKDSELKGAIRFLSFDAAVNFAASAQLPSTNEDAQRDQAQRVFDNQIDFQLQATVAKVSLLIDDSYFDSEEVRDAENVKANGVTLSEEPALTDFEDAASMNPRYVIAMLGTTGCGKSYLANSFMDEDVGQNQRPVVAQTGSPLSTSGDIRAFKGHVRPTHDDMVDVVVVDYEGENGTTEPLTLGGRIKFSRARIQQTMAKIQAESQRMAAEGDPTGAQVAAFASTAAVGAIVSVQVASAFFRKLKGLATGVMTTTTGAKPTENAGKARQNFIKILPCVAYSTADIMIWVVRGELKDAEIYERLEELCVAASVTNKHRSWMPSLIVVANMYKQEAFDPEKLERDHMDPDTELGKVVRNLDEYFSKVSLVAIPMNGTGAAQTQFAKQMLRFHQVVQQHTNFAAERQICAEVVYWRAFRQYLKAFGELPPEKPDYGSPQLHSVLSHAYTSFAALNHETTGNRNLGWLLEAWEDVHNVSDLDAGADAAKHFATAGISFIDNVTYALASELLCSQDHDEDDMPPSPVARSTSSFNQGLAAIVKTGVLQLIQNRQPCCSSKKVGTVKHFCTKRSKNHGKLHSKPILVPRGGLKKIFMFWTGDVPLTWDGEFDQPSFLPSIQWDELWETKLSAWKTQARSDPEGFKSSLQAPVQSVGVFSKAMDLDICQLCLSVSGSVPLKCKHCLCFDCIGRYRSDSFQIYCPFCKATRQDNFGERCVTPLRVLSLDGGGLRGLVEIRLLQLLQSYFEPLRIQDLFDVIVGTSAGGIIAMGLLRNKRPEEMQEFLKTKVGPIFGSLQECSILAQVLAFLRFLVAGSVLPSEPIDRALKEFLPPDPEGEGMAGYFPGKLPYCFVTAVDTKRKSVLVLGNHPLRRTRKRQEASAVAKSLRLRWYTPLRCEAWELARATSAAVPVWKPHEFRSGLSNFKAGSPLFADTELTADTPDVNRERAADGGFRANCPASIAFQLAREIYQGTPESDSFPVASLLSLGTGAISPNHQTDAQHAGLGLISLLTSPLEGRPQWESFTREMENVRKDFVEGEHFQRVNPEGLGDFPAFLPGRVEEMMDTLRAWEDGEGWAALERMYQLVCSRLWIADCTCEDGRDNTGQVLCHIAVRLRPEVRARLGLEAEATLGQWWKQMPLFHVELSQGKQLYKPENPGPIKFLQDSPRGQGLAQCTIRVPWQMGTMVLLCVRCEFSRGHRWTYPILNCPRRVTLAPKT